MDNMVRQHYETLGVDNSASSDDIKKAYRSLALQYHPDKRLGNHDSGQSEQFVKLQESYQILSDEQSRKEYDAANHEAAFRKAVISEVITLKDMTFNHDDRTYRKLCRCGGEYVFAYTDDDSFEMNQFGHLIYCDTCSLTVEISVNTSEVNR